MDRFMLKVVIGYPNKEDEKRIISSNIQPQGMPVPNTILHTDDIVKARAVVKDVYMDEKIERYIVDIVFASRFPKDYKLQKFDGLISYGGSPRASINLALAAKAYAFIKRRGYVIPEDVRAICVDVMRHRVGLTYEAEAENITSENIITEILNTVEVP
jgi:MoxR-like ATPase